MNGEAAGARERGSKIGKRIGRLLGSALFVAEGYVWADDGILWALALWGAAVVIVMALWGALHFPWKQN